MQSVKFVSVSVETSIIFVFGIKLSILIHSRNSTHLSPASRLPCTSVSALEPLKNATILITSSTGSVLNRFQLV